MVELCSVGTHWRRLTSDDGREIGEHLAQGLGVFIRGLVGLDRDAATDALSGFITGRTLTVNQLDFANLIITYSPEHRVMDNWPDLRAPITNALRQARRCCSAVPISTFLVELLDRVRAFASPGLV